MLVFKINVGLKEKYGGTGVCLHTSCGTVCVCVFGCVFGYAQDIDGRVVGSYIG